MDKNSTIYLLISNIPEVYHSSDLRNFFSEAVETKTFECFHYRHRPAFRKVSGEETTKTDIQKTYCCVASLKDKNVGKLLKKYQGKHWVDKEGSTLPLKCVLTKVKLAGEDDDGQKSYKTRKVQKGPSLESHLSLSKKDILNLAELKPPAVMPCGNVGTPTTVFFHLIRSCQLPARIISKLGLEFPKCRGKRKYGSVPFKYGGKVVKKGKSNEDEEEDSEVCTSRGHVLTDTFVAPRQKPDDVEEPEESRMSESEEDDDYCEEWERHEALHDDVTEQGRNKERLYEEEIELKWEKGGSGLVFYTDALYWDKQKGDFDERTSDDWDVDTSVYYKRGYGDKDAEDHVQMRVEERRRDGDIDSAFEEQGGPVDKYTRGFGRKLMEKQGWKEGQGLGRTVQGITEALGNDGQHPRDKTGLGYYGEKQPRFPARQVKHLQNGLLISTVYDVVSSIDPNETLLRSNPPTSLSHRQ